MYQDNIQMTAGYFWDFNYDDDYIDICNVLGSVAKWKDELSDVDETLNCYIYFRVNNEVEFGILPIGLLRFLEVMWFQEKSLLEGDILLVLALEEYLIIRCHSGVLELIAIHGIVTADLVQFANLFVDSGEFYLIKNTDLSDLLQDIKDLGGDVGRSFQCPFTVWKMGLDSIINDIGKLLKFLIDDPSEIGKKWRHGANKELYEGHSEIEAIRFFLSQKWKTNLGSSKFG